MFRITSNLRIGGLIVLVVSGSLFYYWYFQRTSQEEPARPQPTVQPIENKKQTYVAQDAGFSKETETLEESETPLSTDDSDTLMSEETAAESVNEADIIDRAEAFLSDGITLEEEAAEVPVSPFGFGPYPEVPDGFPENLMPSWTWSDEKLQEHAGDLKNFELMGRVLVKLWNQGERGFVGVTRSDENGKVYPLYPDIAYVARWVELPVNNGKVALYPAGVLSGGAKLHSYLYPINFIESGGKLPTGIQFVDREIEGINPYEFLNLK